MSEFPDNIIQTLKSRFQEKFPNSAVVGRAVRANDPTRTIGIWTEAWEPDMDSHQIGQLEPAVGTYRINIQNVILSPDEEEGRKEFTISAKLVKVILYRDPVLRVALTSLNEGIEASSELLKRYGVSRQRYNVGQLSGTWNFLATTSFWVETEVIEG